MIADVKASQASNVTSIVLNDGSSEKTMSVGTTAMKLVEYFDFASDSSAAKITLSGEKELTNDKVTVTATPAIFEKDSSASGKTHDMEYKSNAIKGNKVVDVTIALNS